MGEVRDIAAAQTQHAGEFELGELGGLGHTDLRTARSQRALGGTHIGPALQQAGGVANGDLGRGQWQLRGLGASKLCIQTARGLPQKRGQGVAVGVNIGLLGRQLGPGDF